MIDFELFRVKVLPTSQGLLFPKQWSPQLALFDAIQNTPSTERRPGYTWHVGNVTRIDAFGLYFRLGRTTVTTKSFYNEDSHEFVEVNDQVAPFTHVFCDTSLEVCGIGRQRELAPDVIGIARQLEAVLNSTLDDSTPYGFEISPIRDPADFIQEIQRAYAVLNFQFTFSMPNAWDTEEDIQKPVEEYAKAARAKKGAVQISGPGLDKAVVETVARATAASGNEAKAQIKPTKQAKAETRFLKKGNTASVKGPDDVTGEPEKKSLISGIRERYDNIKRGDGEKK